MEAIKLFSLVTAVLPPGTALIFPHKAPWSFVPPVSQLIDDILHLLLLDNAHSGAGGGRRAMASADTKGSISSTIL